MKNLITLVATATVAVGMLPTARADFSSDEARTVAVRFADLDTTRAPGAQMLFRRLNAAARSVCRDQGLDRSLEQKHSFEQCVHAALGQALAEIDVPAVNAYAADRGFGSAPVSIASAK
jgi:UrcA family protein